MADIKFMKTSALAALAVALAITTVSPAMARPVDGDNNGTNWSRGSGDSRSDGGESRGVETRNSAEVRGGGRERGPGYGRDWNDGGTVSRPAAASRGATPAIPERGRDGSRERNAETRDGGTTTGYIGGDRSRTYSDLRPAPTVATDRRDGTRDGYWRDGNRDSSRDGSYRDGHRDGQRDGRWSSGSRDGGARWNGGDYRRWDSRDWRRDTRYNWSQYRYSHRDHYRAGRYYSPYRSYSYSRLSIGFFLDSGFYGRRYWIDDPWSYRLPNVYDPYRWVRYYDDVLLVDIYSGEVVDVIYDFYW